MNGMIVYNLLYNIATDYRVKSIQLAFFKYNRYYPDHQTRKVFDDLLGFRTLCDNYEEILKLKSLVLCQDLVQVKMRFSPS